MTDVGEIVRLQVQTAELKVGPLGRRRYEPAPIRVAESLYLDEGGVEGRDARGMILSDVHHHDHPAGKNPRYRHGVSLLFTSQYSVMRGRFGEHVIDGVAGENILVDTERMIMPEDIEGGIIIEAGDGERQLSLVKPVEPCVEFTRYCLRRAPEEHADPELNEAILFLRGRRGYYMAYDGPPVTLRAGDRVRLG